MANTPGMKPKRSISLTEEMWALLEVRQDQREKETGERPSLSQVVREMVWIGLNSSKRRKANVT